MKTIFRSLVCAVCLLALVGTVSAQQVNTLYFLDNAPVRHYINPAFNPISNFYLSLPVLGYTSLWGGNNTFSVKDLIYKYDGKTISFMHPDDPNGKTNFLKRLPSISPTLTNFDMQLNLLSFGFRFKDKNYLHININEKADFGMSVPKGLFEFIIGGGMKRDANGNYLQSNYSLSSLGYSATAFTEVSVGYSREINEQWTVGGAIKGLLGTAHMNMSQKNMDLNLSTDEWLVQGQGNIMIAAPEGMINLPETFDYENIRSMIDNGISLSDWKSLLKPAGLGAAIDLGFTYQPIEYFSVSASVTDLGFIRWYKGKNYSYKIDGKYDGLDEVQMENFYDSENGFDTQRLTDTITAQLKNIGENMLTAEGTKNGFTRMTSTKINIGIDGHFWDNRVGVGIYNRLRFYNSRPYDELTIGATFRPVHWFNIAASYSFINGRWSSMGAALGLITYEGLGLFLAMDYIPFTYASIDVNGKNINAIPYKVNGMNLAMGLNIVIGHNRDKDRDGVKDKYDLCPDTPRKVQVDKDGCPIDSDGDGVPDYLDQCPDTPAEAYGKIDEFGCPLDSDGDGVFDYLDECPDTPEAAYGKIDDKGCPLDSDQDGVPDYLDECPDTPRQAYGHVDEKGCLIDTDNDSVPDYIDQCPTVPGPKENKGCPAIKKEVKNLLKKAMQGIQFETGKATIKKTSHPLLNQIANVFIENPTYKVEVQGHTDNVGKPEYNQDLSERRAQAVRKYLVDAGVPAEQMTAHGYGDTMPIEDNKTAKGRALNRRVEFVISFEEVSYEEVLDRADPQPQAQPNETNINK